MTARIALGATPAPGGTRFAVRTAHPVELCLFEGDRERRIAMTLHDGVARVEVPADPGTRYGYRSADDPSKLLVDPYAVELDRPFRYDPRLASPGVDTAALMPKAIVPPLRSAAKIEAPLFRTGGLIYEINVRGFTMRRPDVPLEQRGTVAALAHPAVIAHLKRLRVSAVELMPIVAWIDERHLPPLGLANAWGYNPVVPMALDPRLAPGGPAELAATVAALRTAGIGVILDLVLNHTGESDRLGPTLSLRGFDEQLYYAHAPDGTLINDTGTGNTLNFSRAEVRELALDTLRHFTRLGVDGFRLDLATVLARGPGFDPQAPIFADIASNPLLADRVMIAEPWDVGPGGYALGRFPANWLEWNDRFRDDTRRFWRGDAGAGALATRLAGSSDLFAGAATRTVNFVAAHDGFTLADTVAFARRHNDANGENNADGSAHEVSWNKGSEGPTSDPAIVAVRDQDVRALLSTLFASKGTIMLTAGDEFGRSQSGNNNAYAQDNATTWLDWSARDLSLEAFVVALAEQRERWPLAEASFLTDGDWRTLDGDAMTPADWERAVGFELRLPTGNGIGILRVDRSARTVTFG